MQYRPRVIDDRVDAVLADMASVVIQGPRGCGKTTTGLHHAQSSIHLDNPGQIATLADQDRATLLAGDTPRLIDEWQLAPQLADSIRREIDDRQAKGQFILTHSVYPPDGQLPNLWGRASGLTMKTMTLSESGHSTNAVSLEDLRQTNTVTPARTDIGYPDLAVEAVRGGWPALLEADIESAMEYNNAYLDKLCSSDIVTDTGVIHNPVGLRAVLSSLARNTAQESNFRTICDDVAAAGLAMNPIAVGYCLIALRKAFALEELPSWPKAASRKIALGDKTHLADPGLACAALCLSPQMLAQDPEFSEQVFKAMAIRDLSVYAGNHGGALYHHQETTGLKVDAIIEYAWSWAAIQITLGESMIARAEQDLIQLRDEQSRLIPSPYIPTHAEQSPARLRDEREDTFDIGAPAFMAIVTGTEYAYTLPSGVHIIPLATMCP
ncbi:MAG: DUF4143 domain-containing protein [Propionibacteriaceae bacterium]|jgi:predicted AAA+ superfamily ATPase|nr:DUF4143 domain-containing protein [Propionibacteriaceae bacterium]